MKNIHLLPTEKPSRLYQLKNNILRLDYKIDRGEANKHIYITSDEEIKEDYVIAYGVVIKVMIFDKETLYFVNGTKAKREDCKKIILTTDQDLIKDGVQAINDEFLEWFVKNPSCEEVEVERDSREVGGHNGGVAIEYGLYEIIIPKEDWLLNNPHCKQIESCSKSLSKKCICPKEEPKQETLEEAALKYASEKLRRIIIPYKEFNANVAEYVGFTNGAKWQQERMYSEEEVISFLQQYRYDLSSKITPNLGDTTKQWFEQFKNK